jgi:hypothetical protein
MQRANDEMSSEVQKIHSDKEENNRICSSGNAVGRVWLMAFVATVASGERQRALIF